MTKISIIIPCYNVAHYIQRCYDTIRNQQYDSIEIIFVNDGSSDNTLETCKDMALNDSRIVIVDSKNEGVSAARNKGIDKATGELIYFLDADDILVNGMMKYCADNIGTADILVFQHIPCFDIDKTFEDNNLNIPPRIWSEPEALASLYEQKPYHGFVWDKMIRKSYIDKIGLRFNKELRFHEDCLFCFDLYRMGAQIRITDNLFYLHMITKDSSMRRYWQSPVFDERYILTLDAFGYMQKNLIGYDSLKRDFYINYIRWCHRIYFEAKYKKYENSQYYRRIKEIVSGIDSSILSKECKRYKWNICYGDEFVMFIHTCKQIIKKIIHKK